jgi:hypothetical protein
MRWHHPSSSQLQQELLHAKVEVEIHLQPTSTPTKPPGRDRLRLRLTANEPTHPWQTRTTAKMGTLFQRTKNISTNDPPSQDVELTPSGSAAKPADVLPTHEKASILPTHRVNHNGHKVTKHITPEVRQACVLTNQTLTCKRVRVAGKEYIRFIFSRSAGLRPAMPRVQSTFCGQLCRPPSPFDMLEKTSI